MNIENDESENSQSQNTDHARSFNMHNNNNMNYSQDEYTEMNDAFQDPNTGNFMEMVTEKSKPKKMTRAQQYVQNNTLIDNQDGQSGRVTRSGANAVLEWSKHLGLSRECKIAAYTVKRVVGNNSISSPYAPTNSGMDPSLYLQVTWQSITHLFSYYMKGTEANVNKVQGQTNSEKDEIIEEEESMQEDISEEEEDIAKEEKGIAEEDLENGEEELNIANRSTKDTSNRNNWQTKPNFADGKAVYIPIAFLHALAAKQNPWPELSSMRNQSNNDLQNTPFKFNAKNVKLFTEADNSGANTFTQLIGPNRLWVALRDHLGDLIFCLHHNSWSWDNYGEANRLKFAWQRALGAITPPQGAGGGKPSRYQVVPVGELKIKVTAVGIERWRHRTGGAQALFTTFITAINKKRKTNENDGTVSLLTGDDIPSGYRLLSEDPFGLYRTYISYEGYNSYMNFLLLGAVTQDKEVETYRSNREIIDTRALPTRLEKTQEEKERMKKDNQDPQDKISPLDRSRINQNAMKAKDKADMNVIRTNGRDAIKRGDTRAKVKEKSSGDIQTLTVVNVNARKIELAKGQRQFETQDQGDLMASSAPNTARKLLNWQWINPRTRIIPHIRTTNRQTDYHTNEMFNGLYIAEWLHLSAYSWGGLADVQPNDTVGKEGSSQIHPNFVLGTSETNSAMTRFEKAWRDLIEHEGELLTAAGENGRAYGGQLTIIRHPFRKILPKKEESTAIVPESDQNKQNNGVQQKPSYKIPANTGTKEYASFLHDVAHEPSATNPGLIQWAPESTRLDQNLQRAAMEFRWICYQFDYELHINAVSKILRRNDGFKGRTRFYPFRRMLYHKIEHDLDAKVWKDMLKEAYKSSVERG